jgi:uncharacterized protein GlcG (DUF336 family)
VNTAIGEYVVITLSDARRVIAAAESKAHEIGQPMNIAVVDSGGNLVNHVRMDGAWIGNIDISIKKAFTASAFDTETRSLPKTASRVSSSLAFTRPITGA